MSVLVTGANGFVGRALCELLILHGFTVRAALRTDHLKASPEFLHKAFVGDIGPDTNWEKALAGVENIVHLATHGHAMATHKANSSIEFWRVNTAGTSNLVRQAADCGVKRVLYLSSIKVNGEDSGLRADLKGLNKGQRKACFSESDTVNPQNPYAISKWEAEQVLQKISKETGIEIVIIRPPLVYGPGVMANFFNMMHFLAKGFYLPFGSIDNKRSLVALDNLVDLIATCIEHPAAANQLFITGDGEDLSTTELLQRLGAALGRPARLISVPQSVLKSGLKMLGKGDVAQRLCGSLQVDISKAINMLDWKPPISVDEGLKRTAEWYNHRVND